MTFTEIFQADSKEMTATQKLAELNTLVTKARVAYGNEDIEIPEPEVSTTDGLRKLSYVSADGKVACASTAFNTVKNAVIEAHSTTPGMSLDKEIESLIATNPTLCNLDAAVVSAYL